VDVNPISSRHRPFITRTSSDVSTAHHAIAQTRSAPLVSAFLDEQERTATPETGSGSVIVVVSQAGSAMAVAGRRVRSNPLMSG
jgi:hypothetical protein